MTTNPIEVQIQAHIAALPTSYNGILEAKAILVQIQTDPDFRDWAEEVAALEAVVDRIQRHVRNQRAAARSRAKRAGRAQTTKTATTKVRQARKAGATPAQAKSIGRLYMEIEESVNEKGDRKPIADLNKNDLAYVIKHRRQAEKINRQWAEFFDGLDRKLRPGQTVSQVFSERQIENMARSVGLIS